MNVKDLLKPFNFKTLSLKSRVVMAPMTRNRSPKHIPGVEVAKYYQRRAENHVGLIITEAAAVHAGGHTYPDVPNFFGEKALKGWKRVLEAVHSTGGKIFPQLWHAGSVRQQRMAPYRNLPSYGPSAIPHPAIEDGEPPVEMSVDDIDGIILAFVRAAEQAKNIGFDGIEIHGAHGYLVDQFFWDRTNRRADRFGGETLAERTYFASELIRSIRDRVGQEFPISLRISQWKMGDVDSRMAKTPKELAAFLAPLLDAGVDIFHCSSLRFFEPEFPGSDLNLAGWTKKITRKPVITVGSVGLDTDFVSMRIKGETPKGSKRTIDELLDRLSRNEFDLVAVGRALLADPAWVTRVIEDRFHDINTFTLDSLKTFH
jgi:2,4-dienoyl-CoA reductase-like NADH-dependent reductase (Old Yellow Enzyme family)